MTISTTAEFSAFVFERQHHVETEAGSVLAGLLPKSSKVSDKEVRLVGEIVRQLSELANPARCPTTQ
jgi:hypothetical protein